MSDTKPSFENSLSKLGLYIQTTLLGEDHEVAVTVYERLLGHRLVGDEDVGGKAFSHGRVTVASERLQTIDKVGLRAVGRNVEWVPRELRWTEVDFRIEG